jgi:heme/copper-type cytochrome/quinol oxidase subunit 2
MKFVIYRRGNLRFKKSIFHNNNIDIVIIIIIIIMIIMILIIQTSSRYETTEKPNYV